MLFLLWPSKVQATGEIVVVTGVITTREIMIAIGGITIAIGAIIIGGITATITTGGIRGGEIIATTTHRAIGTGVIGMAGLSGAGVRGMDGTNSNNR